MKERFDYNKMVPTADRFLSDEDLSFFQRPEMNWCGRVMNSTIGFEMVCKCIEV